MIKWSILKNGVRVLTEKTPFPTSINLGVLLDVGTRDETPEISGTLHALKKIYLRTHTNSDEQKNYCTIQMSGGDFVMDYDQERTYYHGTCLAHDTYDFLQLARDSIFDEKTVEDAQIAQERLKNHWESNQNLMPDQLISSFLLPVAFGENGIGLPLDGNQDTYTSITQSAMNEFRNACISPEKIIVSAAGVNNHEEFENAVKPYFEDLKAPEHLKARVATQYLGGEFRYEVEGDMTYMALSFEGVPWTDNKMPVFQVLRTAIGEGGGFSTGGPGKGMHSRAYNTFLRKYPFLESVKCTTQHFTDAGLFTVLISGLKAYSGHMAEAMVKEILDLQKLTDIEIVRAKNLLKNQALLTLEKTGPRIEDAVKMFMTFGSQQNYIEMIDAVTPQQVRELVSKVIKTRPTLVILGQGTENVPTFDKFQARLS